MQLLQLLRKVPKKLILLRHLVLQISQTQLLLTLWGDENVSSVGDTKTKVVERPSNDDLVETVTPSVRDTGMEDAKDMESVDIPSVPGTNDLTAGNTDMIPSAADNGDDVADLPEEIAEPTVAEGINNTVNVDIEDLEIPDDASQEKKRSKKMKHKSTTDRRDADVGESSKPKKKLSKEDKVSKRAWRAERKARNAAEKAAEEEVVEEDVQEETEEQVVEEQMPTDGSDEEDVVVVMSRRRKAKGKLKINENRTSVRNKRVTDNVALNNDEEKAKWKFVANRRINAERCRCS
ncbi:hypothetical protein LIER_00898 [Lithospermum erythrorhizon]|uniref:Uncharacterized protein n=1 Tax=Lithospermum erythrorhizon TaxID=34254 RepID=A0AAV3NNT7_LITER